MFFLSWLATKKKLIDIRVRVVIGRKVVVKGNSVDLEKLKRA